MPNDTEGNRQQGSPCYVEWAIKMAQQGGGNPPKPMGGFHTYPQAGTEPTHFGFGLQQQ